MINTHTAKFLTLTSYYLLKYDFTIVKESLSIIIIAFC